MTNLTVVPPTPATPPALQNPLERISGLSLMDLVNQRNEIEHMIVEDHGELTSITEDLFDNVNDLLQGKIDRVSVFVKKVIPSHIEACKKQIQNLQWLEDKIKDYTLDCIKQNKNEALQGLAWRARAQANPPSIVIDNPDQVPQLFKKATVVIRCKFDPSDANVLGYWEEMIESHRKSYPGFEGDIVIECDNAALREAMLDKKDKKGVVTQKGLVIDGARVEQGKHVRYEEGRAKAKTVKGKKEPKEIEQ